MNKQVTMKMWSDTRSLLNVIKGQTREPLVLIMHRLVADEAARLANESDKIISTWSPRPRPKDDRDYEVEDDDTDDVHIDPRCESRCPHHTPWSVQAVSASPMLSILGTRTRCVLDAGHSGVHVGPDDSMWEQEEELDND